MYIPSISKEPSFPAHENRLTDGSGRNFDLAEAEGLAAAMEPVFFWGEDGEIHNSNSFFRPLGEQW